MEVIHQAYFGGSERSIENYFRRVGLIGDMDPEQVMQQLLFDGARPRPQYKSLHDHQLGTYLLFKVSRIDAPYLCR